MRNGFLIATYCWVMPAQAGTVLQEVRINLESGQQDSTSTLYAQDGRLRLDQIDEEGRATRLIFTGDRVYDIDLDRRTYSLIDKARLDATNAKPNARAVLRAELLALVPPRDQSAVEKIMSQPVPKIYEARERRIEIRPTAQRQRQQGWSCRMHEVLVDDAVAYEYCTTPVDNIAGAQDVLVSSRALSKLVQYQFDSVGMGWMANAMAHHWTHAYALPGFPVIARDFEEGAAYAETRLDQARTEELPTSTFELPSGLRRVSLIDFFRDELGRAEGDDR